MLAGVAMAVALVLADPATTVAAFGAAGLGMGTLIPSAMRSADAVPGLAPGVGLTLVGSVARVVSLGAAPLIGFTADATSLRTALVAVPLAALLLVVLAPSLRARTRGHRP